MADLDKWTTSELKRAEKDLLEKKRRRQEIPAEISSKEQEIQQLRQKIAEYQNAVANLEKEAGRLQNEIYHLNKSYQSTFQYTDEEYAREMNVQRARIQAQIQGIQQRLSENNEQQRSYKSGIASANERIRVLELEIANLKAEDQRIVDQCKEYITTFHDVAGSAEKAARSHQGASSQFGAAAGATRFGKNAILAGKSTADNKAKHYRDVQEMAVLLERLALEIIDAGGNGSSTATAGGNTAGYSQQSQKVMGRGYAYTYTPTASTASSSIFPENLDGTTNFTSVSMVGELPIDPQNVSKQSLDDMVGEQYGLSAEAVNKFRKDSGIIWRIEGRNAYLIHKEYEGEGSVAGYTLDDFEETPREYVKKRSK